ncbi:MAG: PilZ domain-containing protein [Thermodesulfobacteriota bacterium]|nr:PilZ domain-containing protein [Thermodesulfobacteriota bacterium]
MDDSSDMRDSVANRIIEGSITIDSLTEFENLLKVFPNNPRLHRVFADFLAQEKPFEAVDAYRISTNLFIQAGQTLQAIVSKIFEWRLAKPSHQEEQEFYSDLHKGSSKEAPVQSFFSKLSFQQLIAFMNELTPGYFPAQSMVKKFGDPENDMSFVVSGALEQTSHHRLKKNAKVREKTKKDLIENDFFGEIYPFEEEKISQTDIKTITRVELAKISKFMLTKVCRQYPDVEPLVDRLYISRLESDEKKFSKIVRKTVRHQLPTQVNVKVFQDPGGKSPLEFTGFTDDISLGGACVILGAKYQIGPSFNLTGRNVKIQMCLPIESITLNILGTIVWGKDVPMEGKTTAIVGIQFKEMTDNDRGLLKDYCYGSEGEQNLIWSLWNSLLGKS